MSSTSTPPDNYFNEFSNSAKAGEEIGSMHANGIGKEGSNAPKPTKRIACILCRKRKLKCDGTKPSCSTCARLGHSCSYDEVRKKSGPKRGYVKALEERLKQVEALVKTQDQLAPRVPEHSLYDNKTQAHRGSNGSGPPELQASDSLNEDTARAAIDGLNNDQWQFNVAQDPMTNLSFGATMDLRLGMDDSIFCWEMIGLGLEEPLPAQEAIDELQACYFEKIHPSLPMIHRPRFLAALDLAPHQRPPICLRYAMWALAASVLDTYMHLKEHFYHRSRKYMELDTLKGHGESMVSVAHAQTHLLLCSYEFKMMYFPRAWMSTGAAVRMCQMMSLHKLDNPGLDAKQFLPPPKDWTEREERRRTFWLAFCEDRYASVGTGWPMTIEEKDIVTDLPASEHAFDSSKPESTQSLCDSMTPTGASKLSPFAGVVLMACLFGRNIQHLQRPDAGNRDDSLSGEFWKRHRQIDSVLLNTSLSLPDHLRLPRGIVDHNIVFTNMNIHASTICLHQAAICKADRNGLSATVSTESKARCVSAANETANIMRMISHQDLSAMNPFLSFCLYVAARVFVQNMKISPNDAQTGDSFRFLLSAMSAMKRKNPLAESFLVQLEIDLEGLGMQSGWNPPLHVRNHAPPRQSLRKDPEWFLPVCYGNSSATPGGGIIILDESPRVVVDDARSPSSGLFPPPNHIPAQSYRTTALSAQLDLMSRCKEGITSFQEFNFEPNDDAVSSSNEVSEYRTANSTTTPPETQQADRRQSTLANSRTNSSFGASPFLCDYYDQIEPTGTTSDQPYDPTSVSVPEIEMLERDPAGQNAVSGQRSGLTPVGEGVFRLLMDLGPMQTIDIESDFMHL